MSQPEITVDDGGGGSAGPSVKITESPPVTPTITTQQSSVISPPGLMITPENSPDPVKLMKEGKFTSASPGLNVPGKAGSTTSRISARFRAVGNLVSKSHKKWLNSVNKIEI